MKKFFIPALILGLIFASCVGSSNGNTNDSTTDTLSQTEVGAENADEQDLTNGGDVDQSDFGDVSETAYQRMHDHCWKVKAPGEGITAFFKALLPGVSEYYTSEYVNLDDDLATILEEGETIIDEKSGYVSNFMEGAGSQKLESCYWKRTDGKKIVAFYYRATEMDADDNTKTEAYLCFFEYNKATCTLEPIADPFVEPIGGPGYIVASLPRQGKDIKYFFAKDSDDYENAKWKTLKWNGMQFE